VDDIDHGEGRPSARHALPPRTVGIAFMAIAVVWFTGIDTSAKWLGRELPPIEITFLRYLVALVISALVFRPGRVPRAWRMARPMAQILRGLCLLGSTALNFVAVRHLQLAETMTIAFSAPFLITVLSAVFLRERVEIERWIVIAVGFLGVVLVARPTSNGIDPMMLVAFLNICCYAAYAILTRRLSTSESPESLLLVPAAVAVVSLAPFVPSVWVTPSHALTWAVLLAIGCFGALGHFFLIAAFARAPASVVAPFGYTQIVWMTLAGWIFFADVPGFSTVLGGAVVILSGLWLLWRERRRDPRANG
jgi:drug/metabolite transporter (DMT)-like permease